MVKMVFQCSLIVHRFNTQTILLQTIIFDFVTKEDRMIFLTLQEKVLTLLVF